MWFTIYILYLSNLFLSAYTVGIPSSSIMEDVWALLFNAVRRIVFSSDAREYVLFSSTYTSLRSSTYLEGWYLSFRK